MIPQRSRSAAKRPVPGPAERRYDERTMRTFALALVLAAAACGGPALQNVPSPNKAAAAGVVAGAAAAVTLADPQGAAAKQETKKNSNVDNRKATKQPSVPPDVLDRLDDKKQKERTGQAPPPTSTTPEPTETNPYFPPEKPKP